MCHMITCCHSVQNCAINCHATTSSVTARASLFEDFCFLNADSYTEALGGLSTAVSDGLSILQDVSDQCSRQRKAGLGQVSGELSSGHSDDE